MEASTHRDRTRLGEDAAETLWRRWVDHRDIEARNRLVLSCAPIVKALAARKARELPAHCEMSDLVSSGLVALIRAIDRFDPSKGATLEHYVWTRVSGAILDELRRQDWAPRSLRRKDRDIEAMRSSWQRGFGRCPTEAELASALGVAVCDLRRHRERMHRADVASLNAPVLSGEEAMTVEVIDLLCGDARECDPETVVLANDQASTLNAAIAALSPRERQVLTLAVVDELSGAEIGKVLGLSASRVSQLLSGIRGKLKARMVAYNSRARAA